MSVLLAIPPLALGPLVTPIHINQRTAHVSAGDQLAVAGLVEHNDMGRALPQDAVPEA